MKIELTYDEEEDIYYGKYLKFKSASASVFCIINNDEELLGHIEQLRVGAWLHWCVTLEDGCYLSPGCMDEVREMQRRLGGKKNEN